MRYAVAAVILVAIVAVVAKLALSPYHRVLTAEECRAAFAEATTHADSVAVSFMPFDDGDNAVDRRCSSVLTVRELSTADFHRP